MSDPRCRLCGSADAALVSREVSDAPDAAVYRCGGCGVVYLFPIMTEAEERTFYAAEFEAYMQGRAGAGWKTPEERFASAQPEARRRMGFLAEVLRPGDAVLEIGSSTGFMLDAIRPLAASVTGVEPGEEYRGFANGRGLETVRDIADLDGRRFDVILAYYVLEHMRDPVAYLSGLRARLNPGGRLVLEVPNVGDVLASRYAIPAFGAFYWQRAHYYYYAHDTLAAVLGRAGFGPRILPEQRYDLSNHMIWMRDGRPGGSGRFADIFPPALEQAYKEALRARWLCDTLVAVAENPGDG